MKEWPKGNEIVSYSNLINPITKIFKRFFKQTKKVEADIPYDGYNFGESSLTTNFPPNEKLTKFQLDFGKEDQDKTLLDVLINIIFGLGVEQGRRLERSKIADQLVQVRFAFRMFEVGLTRLNEETRFNEEEEP